MSWLRAGWRPLDLTLPASAPLAIFAPSAYAYLVEVTKHVVFQGSNEDFEGDTQIKPSGQHPWFVRSAMPTALERYLRDPRTIVLTLILAACSAHSCLAQVTIQVNTTQQGQTNNQCSLQEAIYAAELKSNIAISSTNPDTFYGSGCVAGTGLGDIIALPAGGVFSFDHFWDGDGHNIYGPTATPILNTRVTIEGNGATLQWTGTGNSRLFAIGTVKNDPKLGSGTGDLTLKNVYIKGFHVKGGDGGDGGGGGGLGAGGAIFNAGTLVVEYSTFENNGAVGGNGTGNSSIGNAAGGGGMSGNGGRGCNGSAGGGGGARGDGGNNPCSGYRYGGSGGGGTVLSGQDGQWEIAASGGFECGGDSGSIDNDGHDAKCDGGGGGGAAAQGFACELFCYGNGGQGKFGGGGGGGQGNGGNGGFGGGGGSGYDATFRVSGGNGGFGGGGGAATTYGARFMSPGEGGPFGGRADNAQGGGGGALGGAIFNQGLTFIVRNSTFFNNYVARGNGGGVSADNGADAGGAIFSLDAPLIVTNSTFSGNQSTGSGGAIVVYSDQYIAYDFNLSNTIIANNGANECFSTGPGTAFPNGSAGNLIMHNGSGGKFGACPGVVTSGDPQLQPLQLNSPGNTPTMAISSTSPALNAADPGSSLPFDQRGVPRPQLGTYDIGAYELSGVVIQ